MYFDNPCFKKVEIEVISNCNFKCWFCPNDGMDRKHSRMSTENFKEIVTDLSRLENLSIISIGGFGEPTLHPNLIELVSYAKEQKSHKVHLTTNGSKFIDDDYSLALLKTGIDKLMISLRITDPKKHKTNLPSNFDYQKHLDSILNIISLKYKHGFNTEIQIALFKDSFYSKYFLKKNINDFIDPEVISNFFVNISKIIKKDVPSYKEVTSSRFAKASNVSVLNIDDGLTLELDSLSHVTSFTKKYSDPEKCLTAKYGACLGLYNHFAIYSSGVVSTCCADFGAKNALGNIFEEKDIINILSNKKSVSFSDSLRRNVMPSQTCQLCRGGTTHLEKWGNFIGNMLFYNRFTLKKNSMQRLN